MITNIEREVIEASLSVIRSSTSSELRSRASQSLEHFNKVDDVSTWKSYANILTFLFDDNGTTLDAMILQLSQSTASVTLTNDSIGVRMILLTMLNAKVRKQYHKSQVMLTNHQNILFILQKSIMSGLVMFSNMTSVDRVSERLKLDVNSILGQLCSLVAALAVRSPTQLVMDVSHSETSFYLNSGTIILGAQNSFVQGDCFNISTYVYLRILYYIPLEASAILSSSSTTVDSTITSFVDSIINCVMSAIAIGISHIQIANSLKFAILLEGLKVLHNWTTPMHISLSQLNHIHKYTCFDQSMTDFTLLSFMIQLLSKPDILSEELMITTCQALTLSILESNTNNNTDSDSSKQTALSLLYSSIADFGFLIIPFQMAQSKRWDEVAQAIGSLACTLAVEDVDSIASFPSSSKGISELIQFLFIVMKHPHHSVAITPLEFWLVIQDIPLNERHPDMGKPLFSELLNVLVARVAYPTSFSSWEDEVELDIQEFNDVRRSVDDVLTTTYYLLRNNYIDQLMVKVNMLITGSSQSNDWIFLESIIFCINSVSRGICDRMKSKAASSTIVDDKQRTSRLLISLLKDVCLKYRPSQTNNHSALISTISNFLGVYGSIWNDTCPVETIFEILDYLKEALIRKDICDSVAKSIRLVAVACRSKISSAGMEQNPDGSHHDLLTQSVSTLVVETVTNFSSHDVLRQIAEAVTRMSLEKIDDKALVHHRVYNIVCPILQITQNSFNNIRDATDTNKLIDAELILIQSSLIMLKETMRFVDGESDDCYPLSCVSEILWSTLSNLPFIVKQHDETLSYLISVHIQTIQSSPSIMKCYLNELITLNVQLFQEFQSPCALNFVAAAVEQYSTHAELHLSFQELYSYLFQCVCSHIEKNMHRGHHKVVTSFFELSQRYLLFLPQGLICNREILMNIFQLSISSIDHCGGERDCTRAILVFLTQIIGWKSLRLTPSAMATLESASLNIDNCTIQYGGELTSRCISGLSGGFPQMLWSPFADCLSTLLLTCIYNILEQKNDNIEQMWVRKTLNDMSASEHSDTLQLVMELFFTIARQGLKVKEKLNTLLLDYASVCNGDKQSDIFQHYTS